MPKHKANVVFITTMMYIDSILCENQIEGVK